MDARGNVSPVLAALPVLGGLLIGSTISIALNVRWGWHAQFVSMTPAMVLAGGLVVTAAGELWRRLKIHLGGLLAVEALVAVAGLYTFRRLRPEDWLEARARIDDLIARDFATETGSLFSTEYAVFFGPLYQLGVGFYLGLAVLGFVAWVVYRRYEPGWLLVGTYVGYLLVLAGIQVRFAGQLAIPLAILSGFGVVYVLSTVDLARRPLPLRGASSTGDRTGASPVVSDGGQLEPSISLPDRRATVYVVGIGLLVFGLSLVYVPGLIADTTYSDGQVAALEAIDEHAAANERTYPENYVLSEWGDSRMYNHFVNGESRGYGYAQSNYEEFITSSDPDNWYDQFEGRVGYVVVTERESDLPAGGTYSQLLEDYGAGGNETDGVAHYQALFVDDDVAAFAVVPGATITGTGEPGATVSIESERTVSGERISYEQAVNVDEDGSFAVTVPFAGTYTVNGDSVNVSTTAVTEGETISLE
ncbi:dolichyl-diphosphooligosaccharide--protein glycosyltransferase [Halobiforma haloterrestris]|uniref:Dolichyl-diphosphooligosaccharide--protein glycosyltransferase n=1 Tax=Natronobacterium haloterrestre TaxID=148448 RepID=A0A1I1KI06_NATHA|nr:dolichyl-diphosphooligosaccharide--protein glycosyltransferase [Halobiforma haloterrestris]